MLIEPNHTFCNAPCGQGSQMDVNELHQYVSQLREYIVTLERRIATLEKQVNPPETVDIGNGRRSFTRHGINKLLDNMYEESRQKRFGKK
jgi:hypothetical protein